MTFNQRHILAGALAAPAVIANARLAWAVPSKISKISHQFPGGTIDQGDFRDRLCRKFAAGLEAKTGGELGAQVYPNSSMMKTVAQFAALRKGALDLSLVPISYAGGEVPELNIGLMPGLVSSYKVGAAWKSSRSARNSVPSWPRRASSSLPGSGRPVASSVVRRQFSSGRCKGLKIRGGSREMDMVLQAAGATTLSIRSNELYAAMQTGACDAGLRLQPA